VKVKGSEFNLHKVIKERYVEDVKDTNLSTIDE
jgi:hypothetical protein